MGIRIKNRMGLFPGLLAVLEVSFSRRISAGPSGFYYSNADGNFTKLDFRLVAHSRIGANP